MKSRNPSCLLRYALGICLFISGGIVLRAAEPAGQVVKPEAYDHPVRVACLGDSITMGVGTQNPATESYPAQLQAILGPKWNVTNFGVGGRTLLRKADPFAIGRALKAEPDVVVIILGTNDSRQQTWEKYGSDFVGDYSGIIQAFKALPSHPKIWICCPPPIFSDKWSLSEEVLTSQTIPAIQQAAKDNDVSLIDLHAPFQDEKEDFRDTVHPNAKAAHHLAELVAAALTGEAQTKQ